MASRLALVLALCLAATLAAATAAEAKSSCSDARSRGARIIVKTREAVVYTKGFNLYGCLTRHRPRVLPNEGGGWDLTGSDGPQLAGRYVAFTTLGSGIGDEVDRVYVYDLRLGKTFLLVPSNFVTALVLKRNGSVAWIDAPSADSGDQPVWQVRKYAHEERQGAILVDRGADIDNDSLALGADRNSIVWTRGGAQKTASLR